MTSPTDHLPLALYPNFLDNSGKHKWHFPATSYHMGPCGKLQCSCSGKIPAWKMGFVRQQKMLFSSKLYQHILFLTRAHHAFQFLTMQEWVASAPEFVDELRKNTIISAISDSKICHRYAGDNEQLQRCEFCTEVKLQLAEAGTETLTVNGASAGRFCHPKTPPCQQIVLE